jgi:GT2 family glycosyltransferase
VDSAPRVSYVLVNWRTERYLPEALASIRAQNIGDSEIILVDNASPSFDPALIEPFQPLTLIRNARNLGFAGGNNMGIAASTGEFIVLVNCDARLDPGFTAHALEVFAANPRIGTVVPKLLRADGSGRLESSAHLMRTDRTPSQRGMDELDQGQYDHGGFVFGGSAAAIVYRRAMLEQIAERVGGTAQYFDETFFAYFEDVDLDWRAQLAGWEAYYQPRCVAWHHAHGSGGRSRWRIRLRAEKNRCLMLLKNDTLGGLWRGLGPLLKFEAYHFVRWLLDPPLWPAPLLFLRHAPGALQRRWQAGKVRSVAPRELERRWFVHRGLTAPPLAEPPGVPAADRQTAAELHSRSQPASGAQISVIILNYNGLELTRECLRSVLAQTLQPAEIIVVDNGSDADEAAVIAAEFPQVRTLRRPRNEGFTGGVNWGAALATGELLALVNNDALLRPDCLELLAARLERSAAAAVSGRLVNVGWVEVAEIIARGDLAKLKAQLETAQVQQEDQAFEATEAKRKITDEEFSQELALMAFRTMAAEAWQESERNHGVSLYGFVVPELYGPEPACFYPSGGLCLLRRDAIAPLLPELVPQQYFAYHEDVWLGFALRSMGQRIVKEPAALAAHVEASTARRLGPARLRFLQERNRLLNILGFFPAGVIWKLALPLLLQANIAALKLLFSRPAAALGLWWAWLWLLFHPRDIAAHRRRCRRHASVSPSVWLGELSGTIRGWGGWANRAALWWCRALGIPHREDRRG